MLQASARLYRNAYQGIPRQVWWLGFVLLVNRSGTMVIPFLTVYLTGRGFTLGQAGIMMALFGSGSLLGGYLGGWLTDKLGFFTVQVCSLICNGILFIVLGYMLQLWAISICVFLIGSLGDAFRPANATAIAAYSNDHNRTRCYSVNRLATNLGWAIGPAVGGILASINYHLLFWTDGLTCLAAATLLYVLFAGENRRAVVQKTAALPAAGSSAYRDKLYLKMLGCLLLVTLTFFQLFSMLPVYYKQQVHLPEAMIGWLLALNGLIISLVEMVLVYKLEHRRNSIYYMMTGALLIGCSFLMLNLAHLLPVVVAGILLITFGEMFLFPFINSYWVGRSGQHNRGQYAALYTMTFALAQVLAPTLASQVALHWSFSTLFYIDFFVCILAATAFYFLRKQ